MKPTFHKTYGKEKDCIRSAQVIRDENTFFKDACDSAKNSRIRVQPGKGDAPRNCFSKEFQENYDNINWHRDNDGIITLAE